MHLLHLLIVCGALTSVRVMHLLHLLIVCGALASVRVMHLLHLLIVCGALASVRVCISCISLPAKIRRVLGGRSGLQLKAYGVVPNFGA